MRWYKTILLALLPLTLLIAVGVYHRRLNGFEARAARDRAEWQAEKWELEALLARAESRRALAPASAPVAAVTTLSPREIIARLQHLSAGGSPTRNQQLAVYWLEELTRLGQAALPAIQDFLAGQEDVDLDLAWLDRGRGWRDRLPGDFVAPPSLRFGLFDVVRKIGGEAGEHVLSVMQATTGRGIELAYLTRVLHDAAPNRYREPAVAAARQLLADSRSPRPDPLDRYHRDHLLTVLAFYDDRSYVTEAQALLVGDDSINRSALAYLDRTMGRGAITVAAQAYDNPRIKDPGKKEPLARLALAHVPDDTEALAFWQKAINDPNLPSGARSNLIEDLNEVGFPDPDHVTPRDLPLIESRLALLEKLAPTDADPLHVAAFKEAHKDLTNMRRKLQGGATPATR